MSKQDWRTPPWLTTWICDQLGIVGFSRDVAATEENAVAADFYTEKDNALALPWFDGAPDVIDENGKSCDGRVVFCNPPFVHMKAFAMQAVAEISKAGVNDMIVLIGRLDPSTQWFRLVHKTAKVCLITPRVRYLNNDHTEGPAPTFTSCVFFMARQFQKPTKDRIELVELHEEYGEWRGKIKKDGAL